MNDLVLKGKRILVIDDEDEICDLMQGWLSFLGAETITATTGDDGLWKAKTEKPDLIITDVLMPGKTGYEIAEHCKKNSDQLKSVPVIMMSGRRSMREGSEFVDAFVDKPFDPKIMLETIQRLLQKK